MNLFRDFFARLGRGWGWIAAQFGGIALLILTGLAWTRLPEKHGWQVALSLLVPLLLLVVALLLQAGTMRRLAQGEPQRVGLAWGASSLLVWLALAAVSWAILDWCDDQIPQWAGYLNSRASASARQTLFTYDHIQHWLSISEWILRWIVVPGKITPYAMATALSGWKLQWGRVLRILWNWRWWPAVVLSALVGVWVPGHFFSSLPHGSVTEQIGHVILKLAGAYVLGLGSGVLLLGWLATLFGRQLRPPAEEAMSDDLELAGTDEGSRSVEAELPPDGGDAA